MKDGKLRSGEVRFPNAAPVDRAWSQRPQLPAVDGGFAQDLRESFAKEAIARNVESADMWPTLKIHTGILLRA